MLKFRKMTPDDFSDVDALMTQMAQTAQTQTVQTARLCATCASDPADMTDPSFTREEYMRRASGDGWISLLAESGGGPDMGTGDVIGIIFVELRDLDDKVSSRTAFLRSLYVAQSERRARIGTMLYRMAEREARERGARRLELAVCSLDDTALAFCRKMGLAPKLSILEKDITVEKFGHDCAHTAE